MPSFACCVSCSARIDARSIRCRTCFTAHTQRGDERACEYCSAVFQRHGGAKYCQPVCHDRANYKRKQQRADLTCASCGIGMVRGANSRPQGEATCRPCQRRAHGLGPDERVNDTRRPGKLAAKRGDCHWCKRPVPTRGKRWKYCCDDCFVAARRTRGFGVAAKSSAHARGYGTAHQKLRAELLPYAYGTDCVLCGDVMEEGEDLHLDHTEDRSDYRGFAHARCNVRDGARRAAQAARLRRVREGWRPGQDPSARRRTQAPAA